MAHQIIKQPNGRFCIFSTIVDNFIRFDQTEEEIVQYELKNIVEEESKKIRNIINQLNKNEKPYGQFTMSYKEAVKMYKENK